MEEAIRAYPPREFFDKYKEYLAPEGALLDPNVVISRNKAVCNFEATIKKAFKITAKRLEKMKRTCCNCYEQIGDVKIECDACHMVVYCCETCRNLRKDSHALICDILKGEKVDQIVECFPFPISIGKSVLKKDLGYPRTWQDWLKRSTYLDQRIDKSLQKLTSWWPYTGLPFPGNKALRNSLERATTDTFSMVLTIAHGTNLLLKNIRKNTIKSEPLIVHLIGADTPEVQTIQSGLIEIVPKLIGRSVQLVLVAPDLLNHPETVLWTEENPFKINGHVEVTAFPELYHNFWEKHIENKQMKFPELSIIIHPGIHTDSMFTLWKPTMHLLQKNSIPIFMTTYNKAEYNATVEILEPLDLKFSDMGQNPFGSQKLKQTPYEPDHVWAFNSYFLAIRN